MKALVFHGDHDLRYEEVPLPGIGDQEVLIKVKAVGICGSDVHGYEGKSGRRTPPMIMGHEFSGIVERTGGRVETAKPGDRVAVFPFATCGHCGFCRKGAVNQCAHRRFLGVFDVNGAMAEFVAVRQELLYSLPDGADYAVGALIEPLSVAARAVSKADIQPGDTVTIIGAGTIGLLCLILAEAKRPKLRVAVDVMDRRLSVARQLGADFTFNPKDNDASQFISEKLAGGADVVIEAVGIEKTVQESMRWVATGGKVAIVGLSQRMMSLDMHEIVSKEVKIEGSFLYDRFEFEAILQRLSALRASLERLISLRAPLSGGVELFKRLARMDEDLVKVILTDENG